MALRQVQSAVNPVTNIKSSTSKKTVVREVCSQKLLKLRGFQSLENLIINDTVSVHNTGEINLASLLEDVKCEGTASVKTSVNSEQPIEASEGGIAFTPNDILETQIHKLAEYEIEEIMEYEDIYFLGKNKQKFTRFLDIDNNPVFVNKKGHYIFMQHDHIAYRFELLDKCGEGTYGRVFKAFDHKTQTLVAVKMINIREKYGAVYRIESEILTYIQNYDKSNKLNVIKILDHFRFRNHNCLVFELMDTNLYKVIKKSHHLPLSLEFIRIIGWQLVRSLEGLKNIRIIHGDIKPANIVVKTIGRSQVKLADFGLSCFQSDGLKACIQSPAYRAPEVFFKMEYGPEVDMWSLGCVLAELYTGEILFPGSNDFETIASVMEVIGRTPLSMFRRMTYNVKKQHFLFANFPKYCTVITSMGNLATPYILHEVRIGNMTLTPPGFFPLTVALRDNEDPLFTDFISRLLQWEPSQRLTPKQAMSHPFLRKLFVKRTRSN